MRVVRLKASRREIRRQGEILNAKALLRAGEQPGKRRRGAHASLGRLRNVRFRNVRFGEKEIEELYSLFRQVKGFPGPDVKGDNAPSIASPRAPPYERCVRVANYPVADLHADRAAAQWVKTLAWNRLTVKGLAFLASRCSKQAGANSAANFRTLA